MSKHKINGFPVDDAKRPINIHITPSDCRRGAKKDPGGCAAALAIRRIAGVAEARVYKGRVYLRRGNKWLRYLTPQGLRTEIVSFDRGAAFYPGEFRLAVPTHEVTRHKPRGPHVARGRSVKMHIAEGVRKFGANR